MTVVPLFVVMICNGKTVLGVKKAANRWFQSFSEAILRWCSRVMLIATNSLKIGGLQYVG